MATATTATTATSHFQNVGRGLHNLSSATLYWLTHETFVVLVALGVSVAIFVGLSMARRLFAPQVTRMPKPGSRLTLAAVARRVAGRTKDYFLALVSLELVSTYIEAPELLARAFTFAFTIAATLQGAVWLRALILSLIERRAARHEDASQLASALGLVRIMVTAVIWAIALILILDNLGVNVTGLIAGLGVGGIAIGLAAQGIFSDLFAALSIIFDRPFAVGDQINFGDTWGAVENIGLKTTRIRSLTGEQIVISNSNLLGKELRNFARLERRRVLVKVGVIYQVTAAQAEAIPGMFREIVEADAKCTLVRSGMVGFGASSLDYELQFDVATSSYDEMYAERHRIMLGILQRFDAEKIDFAYPTTVLFTAAPDGRAIDPRATATIASAPDSSEPQSDAPATPSTVRGRLARVVGKAE